MAHKVYPVTIRERPVLLNDTDSGYTNIIAIEQLLPVGWSSPNQVDVGTPTEAEKLAELLLKWAAERRFLNALKGNPSTQLPGEPGAESV